MSLTHNTRHFPNIVEQDEAGIFVTTNPALPGCTIYCAKVRWHLIPEIF